MRRLATRLSSRARWRGVLAGLAAVAACGATAAGGVVGCQENDPAPPTPIVITTELTTRWDLLPHRLSVAEVSVTPDPDGAAAQLSGQLNGGSFGVVDLPYARAAVQVWRSARLRTAYGSVVIEIPPTATDFTAPATARVPAGSLRDATARVAFVRGYRISTDEYETPPPFASDPTLPYDPIDGYTTQGIGIRLGEPRLEGDQIVVDVSARNTLGLSDRGDMNAAIPQATTWLRVDYVVVGVVQGNAARAAVRYTTSATDYGTNTIHPHADPADQLATIDGDPGWEHGLVGITAFDLWVNVPGEIDPGCTVVQDATNSWDEPISGPGRYATEMSVRLWDTTYDAAAGSAQARTDLYFTNRASFHEVGNVCFAGRAEVGLLQFDDPEATMTEVGPTEVALQNNRLGTMAIPLP